MIRIKLLIVIPNAMLLKIVSKLVSREPYKVHSAMTNN